jgi:hypothetical protein
MHKSFSHTLRGMTRGPPPPNGGKNESGMSVAGQDTHLTCPGRLIKHSDCFRLPELLTSHSLWRL